MYIKQLVIYGFGRWVDHTMSFQEPLTLLYGKNESGKSTLREFILFMLFGMPPRERKLYMPRKSHQFGGRLTIVDEKIGEYTIERVEGQRQGKVICYLPKGIVKDESWLKNQLKGVNLSVYESIYSFSATDLFGLEKMSAKELGDVILNIGLTGSKQIYSLKKQLNKQSGELFKRYGKNPTLNRHLEQLIHLQQQITDEKKHLAIYEKNQLKIEKITKELTILRQNYEQLQKKKDHLITLQRAMSFIQEYKYYESQIKALPEEIIFPKQGIKRLERLKEQLAPLESERFVLDDQIESSKQKIYQLEEQLASDHLYHQGQQMISEESIYKDRERQIKAKSKSLESTLEQIKSTLVRLNIPIRLEDLMSLSFPFQTQHHWQNLNKEYEQVKIATEHLKEQGESLKHRKQLLKEHLQSLQKKCLPKEKREQILKKLDEHLESPGSRKQLSIVKQQVERERRQRRIYFMGSCLMTFMIFLIGFIQQEKMIMILSLVPLFLGIILLIYHRQKIESFQQTINHQMQASLNQLPYDYLTKQLETDDHLQYEIKTLENELRQLDIEQLQLAEKWQTMKDREQRLNNQLHQIKETYPFLKDIKLTYWTELYHELLQLKRQYTQWEEEKHALEAMKQQQKEFRKQGVELLRKINQQGMEQNISDILYILQEWFTVQTDVRQQVQYEKKHLHKLVTKRKQIDAQLKTLYDQMKKLFLKAKVDTEEDYYEQAHLLEQKETYETALEQLDEQLRLIFQTKDWKNKIDHPLEEHLLKESIKTIENEIKEIKQSLEDKQRTFIDLQAKNLQVEQSEQYSNYIHEMKRKENEFNRLAKRWAVIKTAEQMLQRTIKKYQQKHLQDVLSQASNYFERMTKGVYTNVFLQEEDQVLTVQTIDKQYFDLAHLSKGTLDQLYIAIRLAISQIVGRKYKLPFIIDDAFIHSDLERADKIISILRDIAKKQQVMLFTCHDYIAKSFQQHETIYLS